MPPTISRITANAASADELSDTDYHDIYQEVAEGRTTRAAAALLGEYSDSWWMQFGRGDKPLNRRAKIALRRAVGLPELPPLIIEAIADADPNAAVYRVGSAPADAVLLIGPDAHGICISVNGTCEIVAAEPPVTANATGVARPRNRHTVSLPSSIYLRLDSARKAARMTWPAYMDLLQRIADTQVGE